MLQLQPGWGCLAVSYNVPAGTCALFDWNPREIEDEGSVVMKKICVAGVYHVEDDVAFCLVTLL